MPGKKGQHTRRLKGGDNKKLQERRNAVNKELAVLRERERKAIENGNSTYSMNSIKRDIQDLMSKKKYLNRSETRVAERAAKKAAKEAANAAAAKEAANAAVSTPEELNATANNLNAKEAANAAAKEAANAAAKEAAELAKIPDEKMTSEYWQKVADHEKAIHKEMIEDEKDYISILTNSSININKTQISTEYKTNYKKVSKAFNDIITSSTTLLIAAEDAKKALIDFDANSTNKELEDKAKDAVKIAQLADDNNNKNIDELERIANEINIQNIVDKVRAARKKETNASAVPNTENDDLSSIDKVYNRIQYWRDVVDKITTHLENAPDDIKFFTTSSFNINSIFKRNNDANIRNKYKTTSKVIIKYINSLNLLISAANSAIEALTHFEENPTDKKLEDKAKDANKNAKIIMEDMINIELEVEPFTNANYLKNIKDTITAAIEADVPAPNTPAPNTPEATPEERNHTNNNNNNTRMTHNNRSTIIANNNTNKCPIVDADEFKTQSNLGPNFLSLYGCFMLEGYDTKLSNPSGFLLLFVHFEPLLINKAEAAIYLYLITYKDKYNDILNSTETSDKKIKQLIILRETITRVLIHCIAYYASLCSYDNDMVKYDKFSSGSLQNYSPNEVHEKYKKYENNQGEIRPDYNDESISGNSNNIIDDIISHYFSGKTLENIIKEHIISLFTIENIEKLAAELFGISDDKKEVIRLEILEQNAYPTVLQSFMEIEDKFIGSDLSDKLLNLYTSADSDEKTHEVLKHFKFGLKKDLIGKSPAQVLFSDILYSITISPVRYIGLRELAKKMLSENNKSDDDLKPENVENLHNFLNENNKSDDDSKLCETERDLCLGSTDASATSSSSCETERDLCLGATLSSA